MLKNVPMFNALSKQHLQLTAQHTTEVEQEAETVLVRQGESGRECILLVEGSAWVEQDGKLIAHVQSGDCIGEMAVIDGEPRSATVIADTPVKIRAIPPRSFVHLPDTVPGLERQILISLCKRLRIAEYRTMD